MSGEATNPTLIAIIPVSEFIEHWYYAQALKDHGELPDPLEDIEKRMAYNESDRLY